MMNIAINLLPREIKAKQKEEKYLALAALAIIAVACVLGAVYSFYSWQIDTVQDQVAMLNDQASRMNTAAQSLRAYEGRLQFIRQKQQIAQAALADKIEWSKFLEELMVVTPNDITLTSLNGNAASVTFTGEIPDTLDSPDDGHKPVARWLTSLADITPQPEVWLTSSSKQKDKNRITFTNTMTFKKDAAQTTAQTSARPNPPTGSGQ
ncbi:MAG TPA: hypothetical protein VGK02_02175 [Candidatus Aquicultor sp.]|jgi:Tfp pilus assembly protein PilN